MKSKALELLRRAGAGLLLILICSCRPDGTGIETAGLATGSTQPVIASVESGDDDARWDHPSRGAKQAVLRSRAAPSLEEHENQSQSLLTPVRMAAKGSPLKVEPPFEAPLKRAITKLVEFDTAPFPYRGRVPRTGRPFLDVADGSRRGHRAHSGHVLWEDETFNDNRVLLHIPTGFDYRRPALMVVFLHGHGATLRRDVWERQRVPEQVSESGVNAVLVAPQLAHDARDSSAGKFWEKGGFARFLEETSTQLARLDGDPRSKEAFDKMPIIIVAYSGGYLTAASCIYNGGASSRLAGVVLFDALYGEIDRFASWIGSSHNRAFFLSAFANSTRAKNAQLESILRSRDVRFTTKLQDELAVGSVTFISTAPDTLHRDFVTKAWTQHPIKDLLRRLSIGRLLTTGPEPAG